MEFKTFKFCARQNLTETLLVMKLMAILIFSISLQVCAAPGHSQNVSINMKKAPLKRVFKEIQKQTGYHFLYSVELLTNVDKVDLDFENVPLQDAMNICLKNTSLSHTIVDKTIIIKQKINEPRKALFLTSPSPLINITGKITDDNGQPLHGATILAKGTAKGTKTDVNGNFSIDAAPGSVLSISYIGFETFEVKIGSETNISIQLKPSVSTEEQLVVIGYGTQKKSEVTSATATVRSKDFVQGSVRNVGQLLQGKVAGLTINTPSGDGKTEIMLRGIGTLNSSVQPLILIDGIPGDLNTVSPDDVESVDVLKDASAAAIYGTRGSNGVILVTTRRVNGNIEPTINYTGFTSTQSFVNLPNMLTSGQYRDRKMQGASGFVDEGANTDWIKAISRDMPISYNSNISLRGGNNKTNYIATVGYRSFKGVIITTADEMINSRLDVNHNMFDNKLKLNVNFIYNDSKSSAPIDNVAFRNAVRYNPTAPVYNDDKTYFENFGPTENFNPVAMIRETFGGNHSQFSRLSSSLIWRPVDALNLKLFTSRSKYNYIGGLGHTKQHYTTTLSGKNGEATQQYGERIDNLVELSAEYTKNISSHRFSVLGGYSYQENENQNGSMYNFDFPVGNFSYIDNIGLGQARSLGLSEMASTKYITNLIGFFGRATYNYREKYLLMANLRYEAASQLSGTNQPWGVFPAISIGWRLSEEEFMKSIYFLDNLKLRAGYGVTGTSPSQSFLGVNRLTYNGSFFIDGRWVPSIVPASNANPYLRWEERHETNIGLDFSILKGRITGSIDYYNRQTKGLLYDYQVPSPPNLYPTTKANVGVMENRGAEILVSFIPVQTNSFSWNSNATFSTNKNKLVSLENNLYKLTTPYFDDGRSPTPIGDHTHRIEVGQPIGNFYGYQVKDITDDGHWIYVNGEGKESSTVNPANDRKVIGNGLPKYYASWNNTFRYQKIDLAINMRGAFGFQIMNAQRMLHENPGFDNYNQLNSAYEKVFGKTVLASDVNVENNSYYVEKGDYWKIDNIVLGYSFGVRSSNHIKAARLYISVQNAITFTGYKGMDPEVSLFGTTGSQQLTAGYDDREKYPTSRIFTLGVNITIR